MKPQDISDDDISTGPRSAMKALGSNNPMTLSSVWSFDIVSDADGGMTC